ncbi:hypothetical protein [Paenibacillus sp. DS2015]|uniref:hypothetical protein n=1 Tax=Paenibacillus sp. DS2015 TaxID=3373917 RepID=UPI003D1BB28C
MKEEELEIDGRMVDWENITAPPSIDSEPPEESYELDIDRMVNEGLGGGNVTLDNGLIGDSTEFLDDDKKE